MTMICFKLRDVVNYILQLMDITNSNVITGLSILRLLIVSHFRKAAIHTLDTFVTNLKQKKKKTKQKESIKKYNIYTPTHTAYNTGNVHSQICESDFIIYEMY